MTPNLRAERHTDRRARVHARLFLAATLAACGAALAAPVARAADPAPAPAPAATAADPAPAAAPAVAAATTTASPRFAALPAEKGPYLVGEVGRADIEQAFPAWRDTAAAYVPDPAEVARLAAVDRPVAITCVLGTWCGDSRREVPRFWRLLDLAANPNLELRMFAVGRKDDAAAAAKLAELGLPADLRGQYQVTAVPTFIFTADGHELGRIIETPIATLESDAAGILAALGEAGGAEGGGAWR